MNNNHNNNYEQRNRNEFTHGGSNGKNAGLLFRSLLNMLSFVATIVGVWGLTTPRGAALLGDKIAIIVTVAGAVVLGICTWNNLVLPMARQNRHKLFA